MAEGNGEDTSFRGFDLIQIETVGQRVVIGGARDDGGGQEGGKQENGQHGGEVVRDPRRDDPDRSQLINR